MNNKSHGFANLVNSAMEICNNGGEANLINSIASLRSDGCFSSADALAEGLMRWRAALDSPTWVDSAPGGRRSTDIYLHVAFLNSEASSQLRVTDAGFYVVEKSRKTGVAVQTVDGPHELESDAHGAANYLRCVYVASYIEV